MGSLRGTQDGDEMSEDCYKPRIGEEGEQSYIISPSGKKLYIYGEQSFKDIIDFIEEMNSFNKKHAKAWYNAFTKWRGKI